ncbi:MAG: hypothetical protein KDC26_07025 [Armatimonadetes bacterium]|nr:hypothetical protein [Armatimonadota bacterium]
MAEQEYLHQQTRTREDLNSWVARFAPLVMDSGPFDEPTTRHRLELIQNLKEEADILQLDKATLDPTNDHELLSTFDAAKGQLGSIEFDLRKHLSRLSPGDPESRPDLDALQERLAETAAKIEVGVSTTSQMGSRLDLVTSPPNIGAAMGMLIFALGWNGFTTFHATLMIGGMYKAFGVAAFALLLFYAIFFSVGFAMFWGAFLAGAEESIELEGDQLTIKRKLFRFTHRKKHTLDLDTFARIGMAERTQLKNSERGPNLAKAIILTDDNGRPINLGFSTTDARRDEYCKKINLYIQAQKAARTDSI